MRTDYEGQRFSLPAEGRTDDELADVKLKTASHIMDMVPGDRPDTPERVEAYAEVMAALGFKVRNQEPANVYRDSVGRISRGVDAPKRPKPAQRAASSEVTRRRRTEPTAICGKDRGTLVGYRRHLAAYSTACADCVRARVAELDERWERLGIPSHARGDVTKW